MTQRALPEGYELDDDPVRIDADRVVEFIATGTPWGRERSREVSRQAIQNSHRVIGLYHEGTQVGFARAVSDGVVQAYLADVYIEPEHRGRGLGLELVREMIDAGPLSEIRWLLHTMDAHPLYKKLGFDTPTGRVMERPRRDGADAHLAP